jgi:hypothetical protein
MIFVLGLSLVIVNIAYLVNNKDKEGYENEKVEDEIDSDDEKVEDEIDNEDETDLHDENVEDKIEPFDEGFEDNKSEKLEKLEKLKKLYKTKVNELDNDEESTFMEDKALMKKIKKFDPIIFDTIKNLNPVDIDKINKTINELTNKVKDP